MVFTGRMKIYNKRRCGRLALMPLMYAWVSVYVWNANWRHAAAFQLKFQQRTPRLLSWPSGYMEGHGYCTRCYCYALGYSWPAALGKFHISQLIYSTMHKLYESAFLLAPIQYKVQNYCNKVKLAKNIEMLGGIDCWKCFDMRLHARASEWSLAA